MTTQMTTQVGPQVAAPTLQVEGLSVRFGGHLAVSDVSLAVRPGRISGLIGPNGAGKTTTFNAICGVTTPTAGRVLLEGVDLAVLDDDALAAVRRRRIGFVFQRYNLLPELTLVENVALPLVLDGRSRGPAEAAARAALDAVGMAHRATHRPDGLSGGEQQRGAIARALVTGPAIVLADEPTGALDSVNSQRVVELLQDLVARRGQTVMLVTHDLSIAAAAARTIRMRDGRIESDTGRAVAAVAG